MDTISIFIAGAKNLKEQRLQLKALTNDLNSTYGRQNWDVSLHMNSYENFGDRQGDYDDFIKNQADLVIFLLEDRIGQKTEDEYKLATSAYKQNGHPEVITFVHSFKERTPEIDHLEQLVNSSTDIYYVEYTNTEDLLSKAKERINSFVEKRVNQKKKLKSKFTWRKSALYAAIGLLVALLLFIAGVLITPKSYLVVTTPDTPTSLVKAGMGKDFVQQQIVDGVRETGDSAQVKFEAILDELQESADTDVPEEQNGKHPLSLSNDLQKVSKANISQNWMWRLRKLLGKRDVLANVRLVESEQSFISRITLDSWDGKHKVKTIEAKKKKFASDQKCALSVIKKSAAFVAMAYSPVASALYDYHPAEGLEVYQMNNPWQEDLYTHSEREEMLLENSNSNSEEAPYSLLLLANFYEKESLALSSTPLAQKACDYYNQFLKQNSLYKSEVESKIKFVETTLTQGGAAETTIPDILMQNGVIPAKSSCKQLIVVTDEETLYARGTTFHKAVLHTFEKKGDKWTEVFPAYKVNLGVNGMALPDQKEEGDMKTPSGFYPLTFAFGYKKDIETKMDFVEVGKDHVWVCDPSSPDYNKLVVDTDGKYKNNQKNEKLLRPDALNKYAIAIGYNTSPIVKGKGSAIFLHVERSTNHKTAGCISMPEKDIKALIEWLDPKMNPYIYISKQI